MELENKILKILLTFCVICFLFALISPLIFTQFSIGIDFSGTGEIGDTIGGIMNPFLTICGIIITFLAFYIQFVANNRQLEQFNLSQKKQLESINQQHFFRLFDNLNQKIFSFNNQGKGSYEALTTIIEEYKFIEEKSSFKLGRYVIINKTDCLTNVNYSNLKEALFNSQFSKESIDYFVSILNTVKSDERYESIKRFIKVFEDNNQALNKVIQGIGNMNLYNLKWVEKQFFYEDTFDKIYNKYSGFIDSYLKNLNLLLKFIDKNDEDFFLDYLNGNMTINEKFSLFSTFVHQIKFKKIF